ncbi:hypothetical protein BN903_210 [Halorubrum sp. AJ67]|nr:hypothetical protein BN903_210 [Halorubrum sp. AJ67]
MAGSGGERGVVGVSRVGTTGGRGGGFDRGRFSLKRSLALFRLSFRG